MNRHWTVDELTDRLYGIREADQHADRHLESCNECRMRLEEVEARRAAMALAPEILPARLAAQRVAVFKRIETPSSRLPHWIPALTAAVCLLAVAVFLHRPTQITPQHGDAAVTATVAAASDAQLFADIYTVEESEEPLAAAPMHGLFQEGPQ